MNSLNIGIAGAGISGLIAGITVQRAGHSVSIFESRSRTGGRIQSLLVNGLVVETGPEFIHGKLKETIGLLKEYKISFEPVNGKMYSVRDGHLTETYEMAKGWDELLHKMKSLEPDLPFMEFLDRYFPDQHFKELRKSAIRFAEGFDLADVRTASTQALILEWEHDEEEQYHIPAGYETLIRALENEFVGRGGKIFLNHQIESIDWDPEIQVNIKGERTFIADKLIVTLPISVLNSAAPVEESIIFNPKLEEKQEAFKQIGFGTVTKIVMIWHSEFWKAMAPDAQFILSDCFFPTWWTQYPSHIPMLTGWLGGARALETAGKPDSFFFDKAVESLVTIFSLTENEIKKNLKDYRIFNWKNEPGSRGAYSYARIGFRNSKTVYREPVRNRIYFGGEASYDGPHPGTVEAAVVSGLLTAECLLNDLS